MTNNKSAERQTKYKKLKNKPGTKHPIQNFLYIPYMYIFYIFVFMFHALGVYVCEVLSAIYFKNSICFLFVNLHKYSSTYK